MSITSMCFSIASTLPLPFLLMGNSILFSFSTISLFVDDLVNGLLDLVSTATDGDKKSNLLPFVPMALDDGISANSGAGWGENSLCGE